MLGHLVQWLVFEYGFWRAFISENYIRSYPLFRPYMCTRLNRIGLDSSRQ